jgi:hypothetical protein
MDRPNYMWLPLIYHFVEVPVAIICCCIPALPPVIEKVKLSSFGSYARNMFSRGSRSTLGQSNEASSAFKVSNGDYNSAGRFIKLRMHRLVRREVREEVIAMKFL